MTTQAQKLLRYLQGRADASGVGNIDYSNLTLLVDDAVAQLEELTNAGEIHGLQRDGRRLSYRMGAATNNHSSAAEPPGL